MKSKTQLSKSLVSFLVILFVVIVYISFEFYKMAKSKDPIIQLSVNDKVGIDSVKTIAVRDTVNFFNKINDSAKLELNKLKMELDFRDTTIVQLKNRNTHLQKNYDSLDIKLDFWKQKWKNRTDVPNQN